MKEKATQQDAVAYYRMSSDDQECSIDQQKTEVRAWADRNGYTIVQEYQDEGKSGSKDQHKRTGFLKLLKDAGAADWKFLIVWNNSRFGRLDSIDSAEHVKVLRSAGVKLVSVRDGIIDWDTFAGRIQHSIQAEMSNQYSRSLAADSIRGRLAALERGEWANGSVPFGYDRLYIPTAGEPILVKRSQQFRKPKGWKLTLSVNEAEAETVKFIFKKLLADCSMRSIAADLNSRAVPSPVACGKGSGLLWNVVAIKSILTNPAYMGLGYLGSKGRNSRPGKFSTGGAAVKAGICPVIISPEDFQKAQSLLSERKRTKRKPNKGSGSLSGVVFCKACGGRMSVTHWKGRIAYLCNRNQQAPGRTDCPQWRIEESELLPSVCRVLVERVDRDILDSIASKPSADNLITDLDLLRSQLDGIKRKAEEAAKSYLEAPADIRPMLTDGLRKIQAEAKELEEKYQRLSAATSTEALTNFARWWKEVRPTLVEVASATWRILTVDGSRLSPDENAVADYEADVDGLVASECLGIVSADEATAEEEVRSVVYGGQVHPLTESLLPDQQPIRVEPSALRALLVDLGIKVVVSFREAADICRGKGKGRGRGRKYLADEVVVTGQEDEGDGSVKHHTLTRGLISRPLSFSL